MFGVIVLLMGLALPALAGPHPVVIVPVANLYSKPAASAGVVSQAIYATGVEVLEQQPGWRRVRTPDSYQGWMRAPDLLAVPGPGYAARGKVTRVNSLFANLYAEPDLKRHQPLLMVPFETRLEVTAEPEQQERRWIQLRLPDNRVLLIYGYRHQPFGIRARILDPECRDTKTAGEMVLRDDGGTGDLGYPWATIMADGRILVVYYFNQKDGLRHIAGTILEIE